MPVSEHKNTLERLPELAQPIAQFNLREEIVELQKQESWQRGTGRSSKTLVKQPDFRIVLIALKQGTVLKEHHADGRISVQTLQGRLRLRVGDQTVELAAGQLLAVDPGIPHDVEAVAESAFLLTIAWREGKPHEG